MTWGEWEVKDKCGRYAVICNSIPESKKYVLPDLSEELDTWGLIVYIDEHIMKPFRWS